MRQNFVALFIVLFFGASSVLQADVCASKYSELEKSPLLRNMKFFFIKDGTPVGLVNATNGSYILLRDTNDELIVEFFTSGLFDLYPIKREGAVQFCESGGLVKMVGLGQNEPVQIDGEQVKFGNGGDRKTFKIGNMPELLQRLHKVNSRGIASE